jgi:formylglycine-generating enzyme required for sulfatase activity
MPGRPAAWHGWPMTTTAHADTPRLKDMVRVEGGRFLMGSEDFYPEERPVHEVTVDGFWIDRHPVTNASSAASSRPPAT